MLNLTLEEVAKFSHGRINDPKFNDIKVDTISIDTRTLEEGDVYMPIIGEKLDGHVFIEQAFERGAIASFHEENRDADFGNDRPIIYVEKTNKAFADLAENYRKSLKDIKIIGITGSNGKTTTKDMIAQILRTKFDVKKTLGNLNNEIGVPRTLLRFDQNTQIGVVEMGTDGPGQIEPLSRMACPDIAVFTNVGDTHLNILKTKENIAKEKLHILDGLADEGVFIYNYDDEIIRNEVQTRSIKQRVITFGKDEGADYVIKIGASNNNGNSFTVNGTAYRTSYIGSHQVYNATAAIIVAELLGLGVDDVNKALEVNESTGMRSELINWKGFDILNDSYKSNPQSLLSALDTLDILSGYTRKIAILGDMLELGDNEIELHREVGRKIDPKKVDYLLFYGDLSKYMAEEAAKNFPFEHVFHFDSKDKLNDKVKYLIQKNTLVLVKASRSLRLEEVVEALELICVK